MRKPRRLKEDAELGIMNFSLQQIMNNQSLSAKGKREAIDIVKAYNETSVPKNIKDRDVGIINQALKNRIKSDPFAKGGDDFTLKIKQAQAWKEYRVRRGWAKNHCAYETFACLFRCPSARTIAGGVHTRLAG